MKVPTEPGYYWVRHKEKGDWEIVERSKIFAKRWYLMGTAEYLSEDQIADEYYEAIKIEPPAEDPP